MPTQPNVELADLLRERRTEFEIPAEETQRRDQPLLNDSLRAAFAARRAQRASSTAAAPLPLVDDKPTPPPPNKITPKPKSPVRLGKRMNSLEESSDESEDEEDTDAPPSKRPRVEHTSSVISLQSSAPSRVDTQSGLSMELPPWAHGNYSDLLPGYALHQEIFDWLHYIHPVDEEILLRKIVIQHIREVAERLVPDSKMLPFGSVTTGLFLPTGDVDLTWLGILPVPEGNPSKQYKEYITKTLDRLSVALKKAGVSSEIQTVKAMIPILKFTYKNTGIKVDISVNGENGLQCAKTIREFAAKYPLMAPLAVLIKYMLEQRHFNDVFTGGLGGFCICMMVIGFLQQYLKQRREASKPNARSYRQADTRPPPMNLGTTLVEFFRFYSQFNYSKVGIAVTHGGFVFKKKAQGPEPNWLLSILDPHERDNDLGRKSFRMHAITQAFESAFRSLVATPAKVDKPCAMNTNVLKRPTLLNRILHVDLLLVDARKSQHRAYNEIMEDESMKEIIEQAKQSTEVFESFLPYRRKDPTE
eukprot:NODE_310_length_1665_cov_92.473342_g278_i0.p1 GENE.NODE_310_length_1665_cov_92.473342_g278_i0~~NODE_310_length_1665_cov_92.473342_g278_i0.p1  ORF type:complete len:531 (-),score=85.17 NODE_310_length_1665_cov_92.473342_g278_i0:4-1596(-)